MTVSQSWRAEYAHSDRKLTWGERRWQSLVQIMYLCVQPYLQSAPALHHCPRGSVYIDLDAGLEKEEQGNRCKPKVSMFTYLKIRGLDKENLHPVSFSLLMALERSRMQPRKPAPCRLWIFLWFHILMVIESVFPM